MTLGLKNRWDSYLGESNIFVIIEKEDLNNAKPLN